MPSNIAPGSYVNEFSFQQYSQAQGRTTVAMLGGATKGPLNKPTLVSSPGDLLAKFGPPVLTDYGLEAAYAFLQNGYSLLFERVAHSAVTATISVPGTTGGTPAAAATGTIGFTSSAQPADADTVVVGDGTLSKTFEFDSNGSIVGGRIGVLIGASAAATMANLLVAINNSGLQVTATDSTTTIPQSTVTAKVGGTAGNVTITKTGTVVVVAGMTGGAAAIAGTTTSLVTFAAASPGTWANGVQAQVVSPSSVPGAAGSAFDLVVLATPFGGSAPAQVERFTNLSLTSTDPRFVDVVLANGIPGGPAASRFVTSTTLAAGTPTAATYTLGTGGGAVGADGISGLVPADYVGTQSGSTATGLYALSDPNATDYNVIAIPGVTHTTVVSALIAHAATRGDCLALIDTPFGLVSDDAKAWVDGGQPAGVPNAPAVALNSSYAAVAWPWAKVYDSYNNKFVWVPPSGIVAGLMAATDSAAGPWQPAAGPVYGVAPNLVAAETSPTQAQRDNLYSSNVNPFITFQNSGPTLYGNKTLDRTGSPASSIHARRTLILAKKLIAAAAQSVTWLPNDAVTQKKFAGLCNTAMSSIAAARGLDQFAVVCDASTNPPDALASKQLRGQVVVKTKDVSEQVVVSFSATQDATIFGT